MISYSVNCDKPLTTQYLYLKTTLDQLHPIFSEFWGEWPEKMRSQNFLYVNVFQRIINFLIFNFHFLISRLTRGSSIGLLDLSGFENFKQNGFDQLLINISNEKLQQYFMDYIFPREKKDYEAEGIEWRDIVYHSNDDVLELVFKVSHVVLWHSYVTTITEYASFPNVENFCNRKKMMCVFLLFQRDGILSLLDEESHFPQSNDSSLVQKLNKYCKDSTRYAATMGNRVAFSIRHYAEQVRIRSFLIPFLALWM